MPLLPPPRDVVVVFKATSDFAAIAVRDLLATYGVQAMVRSRRVPGYDVPTLAGDQAGIVSEILVRPEQEAEARALIAEYLAALPAGSPDEPPIEGEPPRRGEPTPPEEPTPSGDPTP